VLNNKKGLEMRTAFTPRIHRYLVLGAMLVLVACSGDDPVTRSFGDENESPTDESEASSEDAPKTGTTTGTSGTTDTGVKPVTKPMDAGVKPSGGRADASSVTPDTSISSLDASIVDPSTADAATTGSDRAPATSHAFATTVEPHLKDQPIFNVTRPTDLTQLGGRLPVIVWANGGCFRSDFTWSPLFKRWAAAGFVVLSLSSEDNLFAMLSTTSKAEHTKLVDWVVAQDKSGPYAGMLDLERIVVAGNSCGGVTALETAAADKRLAAVFVLSGSSAVGSVNAQVMKAISIPVGYVVGGEEDIAGANAQGDYDAMNEGIPAMIVSRKEGDHQTVSTDEKILPEDAEIALNWMDLALYGTKQAHDALTSKNVCDKCTPGYWTLKTKNL